MTRQPPARAAVPHPSHLIDDIQALLDPLRQMHRRHQAALDEHRTKDGYVIEGHHAAYEEARYTTAIEASDTLDTIRNRLERLIAAPAHRAFTIALKGPGHDEGASPWLFVVNATDLDDAHRTLTQLPSYKNWLVDTRAPGDTDSASNADVVSDHSHVGTRAPGTYLDLRQEQEQILASRTASRSVPAPPPPGPSSAAPRRSR
ncbi:hypothetical protein J7I98_25765 [Streptomyces sp. ISL-98]|uniref:hypothetical protein n=1 Tax=Streptomyces sp. ISL-98 TaxID=2819192 RepID=UPI001BEAF4D8|nr:hypothetical protein [Streptomyces sp. ISL-98]MBT2509228.1 hypothetical protein [Streptomyces sp. ISL-98]